MKCPLCGAEVSKDDLFCESCGHNLIQDRPATESAPAAEPTAVDELAEATPAADTAPIADAAPVIEQPPFALPADSGRAPTLPRAKDNKIWLWIAIAVIVLIVVVCCCCIAGFALFFTASSESSYNIWPGLAPFLR
jgi:hypothetical protein